MNPAETMVAAADRLEKLLAAMTSRWPDVRWRVEECSNVETDDCPCIVYQGNYSPFDEAQVPPIQYIADGESPEHAFYIAAMDPVVGGALVAWLRVEADRAAEYWRQLAPDNGFVVATAEVEDFHAAALALARAILGEATS
jgi:hypothetical protein